MQRCEAWVAFGGGTFIPENRCQHRRRACYSCCDQPDRPFVLDIIQRRKPVGVGHPALFDMLCESSSVPVLRRVDRPHPTGCYSIAYASSMLVQQDADDSGYPMTQGISQRTVRASPNIQHPCHPRSCAQRRNAAHRSGRPSAWRRQAMKALILQTGASLLSDGRISRQPPSLLITESSSIDACDRRRLGRLDRHRRSNTQARQPNAIAPARPVPLSRTSWVTTNSGAASTTPAAGK